ncbi:MAG: hypothetical protein EOO65_02470 [Methanosarcinales archaeon]|nr:MAG: hypothetical protein EOO65_02470 [Methanosarcinales archaeon]
MLKDQPSDAFALVCGVSVWRMLTAAAADRSMLSSRARDSLFASRPQPCRHYTYPRGIDNPFGVEVEGWTGHTTYPYLFPEPAAFIAYLKRRGVFVTFNHHPASGVAFHEATYAELASKLGWDAVSGKTIAYDISNSSWVDAYLKTTIKPIDDLGLQYWWLDYQQTPLTPVPMLNPTILSNLVWWNNPHRYGDAAGERGRDRPYLMGRFGGLGAHRYPIGFVGDTYVKWEVLRFETYFMPTASNVAFQWTHDIGGFEGPSPADFFTRHLQFGTFSPVRRVPVLCDFCCVACVRVRWWHPRQMVAGSRVRAECTRAR